MSNLKKFGGNAEKAESGPSWKVTHTPVSRLQRVFRKLGLDEAHQALHQASESEVQAAFARYLHTAENHAEFGIPQASFNPSTLPSISFSEVEKAERLSLLEPFFGTLSLAETVYLKGGVQLDQPPLDEEDFLGCRYFFQFVATAVERGRRVILMQDEKQSVAVMVHVKALRKLNGTALLQVEYNCVTKTDRNRMESIVILQELLKDGQSASTQGTEHQIHFVAQVLQAHERLLDKTFVTKHDEAWYPRQKCIRPSFIVPLSPILADKEFTVLQELKVDTAPENERAPSDEQPALHPCAVCDKKSAKLKICSACKSVKYCSRDCQVSHWPSHKKACKAAAPAKPTKPLPSGASILVNPKGNSSGLMGFTVQSLFNAHDPISNFAKSNQVKKGMPDHEEGEVYVVKVQAGPGHCLIYDRQRSFTTMAGEPREHSALMSAIAKVNHRSGPKCYLYAKNEGNKFRVYLEDFPEQYVNW